MTSRLPPGCKGISFDVGGTLVEPWPSVGHLYAEVAQAHGLQADGEILTRQFGSAWKAKKDFDYTRAHWHELVRQSFTGFGEISPILFDAIYARFTEASAWKVYEDVIPTLTRLKQRGFRLGVISNWDERLRPLLATLELAPFFDFIIISTEIGAHKPSPQIFQAAFAQSSLTPAELLHVGDSVAQDIQGATDVGMAALRIVRSSSSQPLSCDIQGLEELLLG